MSSVRSPLPPRPRVDDHYLLRVASRLTDRDRVLIRLLHQHRVFTSAQVYDIGFDSYRRERLEVLYALRAWTGSGRTPGRGRCRSTGCSTRRAISGLCALRGGGVTAVLVDMLPVTLRLAPPSKMACLERSREKGRSHEHVEMLGARNRRHQPVTRLSTFATRIASLAQAFYPRNVVVTATYGTLVTGLSPAVGRF
jgi:hypothetical protein